MTPDLQVAQRRYENLISSIPFQADNLDYSVVSRHKPYLDELASVGNYSVSVFDLYQRTHVYMSESYKSWLGLPEEHSQSSAGFESLMHPEDLLTAMDAGSHFLEKAMKWDQTQLREYKLCNDFRIRKTDDSWLRVTEQHQILETDSDGNIWLTLSIADISPDQDTENPMRSRLVRNTTGEVIQFPVSGSAIQHLKSLSDREFEILKCVSAGLTSRQIAEKLFISIHTVNTHRQNILSKTDTRNMAEAVRLMPKH